MCEEAGRNEGKPSDSLPFPKTGINAEIRSLPPKCDMVEGADFPPFLPILPQRPYPRRDPMSIDFSEHANYGKKYTAADVERLSAPDVTRQEIGKVIGNVAITSDPHEVVDDIAVRLFDSSWRYDRDVVEYLLDCGNHTAELMRGATPDQARHILDFCISQQPWQWEDALECIGTGRGPELTQEMLAMLLAHPKGRVREAGIRGAGAAAK
jgi:hypothetical protein